jgi:hypothetical protein
MALHPNGPEWLKGCQRGSPASISAGQAAIDLQNAQYCRPGPFVSSTAARAELPHWAATLQWWWRCRLSKWVFRWAPMLVLVLSESLDDISLHNPRCLWPCMALVAMQSTCGVEIMKHVAMKHHTSNPTTFGGDANHNAT